jgi:hypothetical protein
MPYALAQMHRDRMLKKMVDKGLWGPAARYVGSDVAMQRLVVTSLAEHDAQQAQVGVCVELGSSL